MIDVAVVGAGLSGLICAVRLADSGCAVAVLEARDRVGGRTLTAPLAGATVDLGGQWISPGQVRVAALADELGIATIPQVRARRPRIALGPHPSMWSRLPLLGGLELSRCRRELERLVEGAGPEGSLGEWLTQRTHTRTAAGALTLIAELTFAAPAGELSLRWVAQTLAATGGMRGGAGSEARLAGGAQALSVRLAERLASAAAPVRLGDAVVAIAHDGAGCALTLASGEVVATRTAVLALPPPLLERIAFAPALPAARRRLHAAMRLGGVIKCNAAYPRRFWSDRGGAGEAYAAHGLVRAVVDVSQADGPGILQAFVVGAEARQASSLPAPARRAAVLAALTDWFGAEAAAPVDWAEHDWLADPWSAGCVGVLGPGLGDDLAPLRHPVGRLCFAGSETAERWPSYLDGAIEAGERAAAEAASVL